MSRPKQTALIVDDESSIRNILSAQLEELGYECVAVSGGADDYVTKPCDLDYLSMRLRRAHERRDLAKQQGPDQSPSGETAPKQVNPHEITEDLVNQQVARYQRLASAPDAGDEDPKRRR